jgi:hypothetical protein
MRVSRSINSYAKRRYELDVVLVNVIMLRGGVPFLQLKGH